MSGLPGCVLSGLAGAGAPAAPVAAPGRTRHAMPRGEGEPPRLRVPTSMLCPPLRKTLGRSAMALDALATGPAATVRYWPAGTLDSVKVPVSSVRALMLVLWTATSTAPAGRPIVGGGTGCGMAG